MVLTSNRTRELHDALKRRCLYHWIGYPPAEREVEIVLIREPGVSAGAGPQGGRRGQPAARARPGQAARRRRDDRLGPHARLARRRPTLDRATAATDTLGAVVKDRDDLELVRDNLEEITSGGLTTAASTFVGVLVGFARELRAAGLAVGTGDVLTYCAAMDPLDPTDLVDLYWAGRATLVTQARRHRRLRRGVPAVLPRRGRTRSASWSRSGQAGGRGRGRAGRPGHRARTGEGDEERGGARLDGLRRGGAQAQVVRRLHARGAGRAAADHDPDPADPAPAAHPAHRCPPAPAARPTCGARSASRCGCTASPAELYWRQRRVRLRPLILILDISGSMADYSRNLLQFAYSASARPAGSRCSASAPGSPGSPGRSDTGGPDDALERAARAVFDWEGGTRIGESLDSFRAGLGPARPVPRRRRGHLLRRPGPRRPGRAGRGHGAAVAAVPHDWSG